MTRASTISFWLLLIALSPLYAQTRDEERAQQYANDQEQYRRSVLMREYDSALVLMEEQQYEQAEEKFRHVLNHIKSVPSDLTFHFGKNSYHLKKYRQSIDWLNKYIQLKGTGGQFYTEAVEWKQKAENEYLKQKTNDTREVEEVLSTDYDIDCGPSGKVICPVCRGNHVIIKKGVLGNEYKTCGYCNEHGVLTCEEYNKLLRGQLKPKS
jgi:tetratricopeptide (TPR) repeat protein